MKKLVLLVAILLCTNVLLKAQKPRVKIFGSWHVHNASYMMDVKDLKHATMLSFDLPESDTAKYELFSGQFVFAPKRGEARIISFRGRHFSPAILELLRNRAEIGDRLIFDRIMVKVNGVRQTFSSFMCEIVQKHHFTEDSLSSETISFLQTIGSGRVMGSFDSNDVGEHIKWIYTYNIGFMRDSLHGEILYYDSSGNISAMATYKHSKLVKKEYYFTDTIHTGIKRCLELEDSLYIQSHYDTAGYLVAKGPILHVKEQPRVLAINPTGISNSAFPYYNLESEYRPQGEWEIFNRKGKVVQKYQLESTVNPYYSKLSKSLSSALKSNQAQPRKIKSLINPEF